MARSLLLAAFALAACARPAPDMAGENTMTSAGASDRAVANVALPSPTPATSPPAAAPDEAAYLGKWIGVEGMVLDVTSKPGGGVRIDNQWDLDHHGRFDGSVTAVGLRFMRAGVAETAMPSDGDATGLKYLAGKQRCLTVKAGEGYCRD